MSSLPRMALGTVQPAADSTAVVCGLLDALERQGLRAQCFLAQATFVPLDSGASVTGRAVRHLDSWLMAPDACRTAFVRATEGVHGGLVQGCFFPSALGPGEAVGGDLETLCQWLDLPRLAVLDAALLGSCRFPPRPKHLDGVIIDRVRSREHACRLQTTFESLWGVPVLAMLEDLPALRGWLRNLAPGSRAPRDLCHELGESLLRHAALDRICRIAASRPPLSAPHELGPPMERPPLHVALAFDEAFHCYFPDTLEMLEQCGARVSDFSPLRDERLPADTDLVYLGCGHPERFASQLAENHCMTMALLNHLCAGRRLYAEGGGLAYLCRDLETPGGQVTPMVGVFPTRARLNPRPPGRPRAVELPLAGPSWLGPQGTCLRGYLSDTWHLEPAAAVRRLARVAGHESDLVGRGQAIGSRLHIHFAPQRPVFDAWFAPHEVACC